MDTMPLCPGCSKPLAPNAPKGLCQACLLRAAFPTGGDPSAKAPPFVPPAIEELTAKFPQLEILELIGSGGMGAVYRARQKELDRIVALKILPPDIGQEAGFAERFTREARALAKLNHPGIVTIHDFGRANGLFFLLMECVDGVNLRQLLYTGRLSPREALAIVPQICDALQYAHDQGVIHRDIKPENILLDRRGRVKVADFGLAKLVARGAELTDPCASDTLHPRDGDDPCRGESPVFTGTGKVMGTPRYMAPEQLAHPADVDHRADIYALGVVLYQMLTGELPGPGIEPPSSKVQIDVRLDQVVLRALEPAPERRYQQVSEVKTAVETIARSAEARKPAAKSEWVQILERLFGVTFTSPAAITTANVSALGFLGFLGSLGIVPVTWMRGFFGFFGFFGLFGLIGLAYIVELATRSSARKKPPGSAVTEPMAGSGKSRAVAAARWTARVFGTLLLALALGLALLLLRRDVKRDFDVQPSQTAAGEPAPSLDTVPPVVVQTQPASGATDVAPGVAEISVTFSKEMAEGSWSWSSAWQNSTPPPIGSPTYSVDYRTCVLEVTLEPATTYAYWLNSDQFHNFQDHDGRPAVPYLLIFRTRDGENPP